MTQSTVENSDSTFTVIPANLSDASAIATLGANTWTKTYGWLCSPEDLDAYMKEVYTTEAWERELSNSSMSTNSLLTSTTYIAATTEKRNVLGFAQVKTDTTEPCLDVIDGRKIELHRLYVDMGTIGKGVGSRLVDHVLAKAAADDFMYMWVGVGELADKAIRFYAKFGFKEVGTHDFVVGGSVHRDLIMVRKV